jgi:hypothetical protein
LGIIVWKFSAVAADNAMTNTAILILRREGSTIVNANTPIGAPKAAAIAIGAILRVGSSCLD